MQVFHEFQLFALRPKIIIHKPLHNSYNNKHTYFYYFTHCCLCLPQFVCHKHRFNVWDCLANLKLTCIWEQKRNFSQFWRHFQVVFSYWNEKYSVFWSINMKTPFQNGDCCILNILKMAAGRDMMPTAIKHQKKKTCSCWLCTRQGKIHTYSED